MVRLTIILALLMFLVGCEQPNEPVGSSHPGAFLAGATNGFVPHVTGEIEFEWKGGNGAGSPDLTKYAFASLEAFSGMPVKGEFRFWVQSLNGLGEVVVHRQIVAEVIAVQMGEYTPMPKDCQPPDPSGAKVLAWFEAIVVSDTKGCGGGSGPGGHEPGCPGSSGGGGCEEDPDGGCAGDDGGHDEGCSGSGGSGGMGGEEGGCSGHDGTDEGGCSGSGGSGGYGEPGGNPSAGNPASGKYCRVGQHVVVKVHDGGTPGTAGDGIKWKWFAENSSSKPSLPVPGPFTEPKLCKKTILGGNLVIHLTPDSWGE